jgi:hypothetical protein
MDYAYHFTRQAERLQLQWARNKSRVKGSINVGHSEKGHHHSRPDSVRQPRRLDIWIQ